MLREWNTTVCYTPLSALALLMRCEVRTARSVDKRRVSCEMTVGCSLCKGGVNDPNEGLSDGLSKELNEKRRGQMAGIVTDTVPDGVMSVVRLSLVSASLPVPHGPRGRVRELMARVTSNYG